MSSDDFSNLHDVYEGLDVNEKCQKTVYILQFLWRDISSDFDLIGPYFDCASTMEAQYIHGMITRTMLALSQFRFRVRALLCDGGSNNLSVLKLLCGYKNNEGTDIAAPSFKSPFDGGTVFLIVCPSHQVSSNKRGGNCTLSMSCTCILKRCPCLFYIGSVQEGVLISEVSNL